MKIVLKKGATIYLKRFLSPKENFKIETDKETVFDEEDLVFSQVLKRRIYVYNMKDSDDLPTYNGEQIISIEWFPSSYNENIIE